MDENDIFINHYLCRAIDLKTGVSVLDMLSLNNILFANNSLAAGSFELYFKVFFAN